MEPPCSVAAGGYIPGIGTRPALPSAKTNLTEDNSCISPLILKVFPHPAGSGAVLPEISYLGAMKEVSVGILRTDGRVLACQRRRTGAYPLKWEFPGGKIEPGETPREALRRELREELGVEASVGNEFHRQDWVYPEGSPKQDDSFRVFYFLVDRFSGTPANRAFEQIRWVTPEELAQLDILEGNREAVELLKDHERPAPHP